MQIFDRLGTLISVRWLSGSRGRTDRLERDRGDVPGWVMVTVMTAILVVAIIGVFEPQIKSAISNAIDNVTNSGAQ